MRRNCQGTIIVLIEDVFERAHERYVKMNLFYRLPRAYARATKNREWDLLRCRGTAGRTRARHLLRNGAAMGAEVRSRDRATAAPASPSAERSLAFGRDGGAHRRQADLSLARRR